MIEQASKVDAYEILNLQKLAYKSEAELYNDFTIPPLIQTIEEIKEEFSYKIILKYIIENKIVGSVRAYKQNNNCFIGRVIVHPVYQNQGIGKKLMNAIERKFSGVNRFELFTGYRSEKNLYLYKKLGYKIFKTEILNDKVKLRFLEKIL